MFQARYNPEIKSDTSSPDDNDDDSDSEVEYPLIDLKGQLSNDLKERRKKDIDKYINKSNKVSKFKNTEFSREVIGHNKMSQFQMTKAVNYIFSEFDYLREKIKRAQQQTVKQLQEIHCDKRKQLRESYQYHNEELRYDLRRAKEEEKFLEAQAELEDMMRNRERSIARISMERKILMKEINLKEKEKHKPSDRKSVMKNNGKKSIADIEQKVNEPIQSRSHSLLHAGAIEITKDYNNPRTIKRSTQYIEDNGTLIPLIQNDDAFVPDLLNHETVTLPNIEHVPIGTLNNLPELDENVNIDTILPVVKYKTVKEIMKERRKQKEKQLKEIINLPYNMYRRNSKGKLQKVDHPLPKCEFKEPSNKDKYKMRKVLGMEKDKYQNYISELVKTTEKIIEEDITISKQLNSPQIKIVKETNAVPQRMIGPSDWMNSYVSSNIPENIDPSSTEAIIYCRYIRAPLHKYSHLPNYKIYHTPL